MGEMFRFSVTIFALSISSAVFAQQAAHEQNNDAASDSTDIIVTATRRAERLQDVPVAVTALAPADLANAGVSAQTLLGQVTPSLVMGRTTFAQQPVLRGVGNNIGGAGVESPVATYVDGIYQPESTGLDLDLMKVDRIEVLRGPQGTLFGRNSTGGLINIITPEPAFEPSAEATIRYGSYDAVSLNGYVTGALTDRLAANLSFFAARDDGYVRNLLTNDMVGSRRSIAVRGKLLFEPSDDAKIVLTALRSYLRDDQTVATQPIAGNVATKGQPGVVVPSRPNEIALSLDPTAHTYTTSASLATSFQLGAARLETTSSYAVYRPYQNSDTDYSNANVGIAEFQINTHATTQEIRLIGDHSENLSWVAGLFGFYSVSEYPYYRVSPSTFLKPRVSATSIAPYAEGTLTLTEGLKATVGGRFTYERRTFRQTSQNVQLFDTKTTFRDFSPKGVLQYVFSPSLNIYASVSKAFKSGLYNALGTNPTPVKPEKNIAYEGGLKSKPFRWLTANAALFYYDYTDLQVNQRISSTLNLLTNAGKARIRGGELELRAEPSADFSLRVSAGYLDARYTKLQNAIVNVPRVVGGVPIGGNSATTIDASGNRAIRAPRFTGSAGVQYSRPFGEHRVGLTADIYHSSELTYTFDERLKQKPYELVGGSIFWELPGHRYRMSVWGTNLTNAKVLQYAISTAAGDSGTYIRPRSIGISLSAKY